MRTSNLSKVFSRFVVSSLVVSLLLFQTMIAKASAASRVAAGEITVAGPSDNGEKAFVEVNGERAFTGRTFFSNSTIATTETSSATISLGRLGRIELAPASSLVLSFADGRISGTLSNGSVTVSNTDGVDVEINTPTDSVVNENGVASRFTLVATGQKAGVAVANGTVRANGVKIAKDDDDDDDDDDYWKVWATVAVVAGAVVLVVLLNNNDDDNVSPVR